MTFPLEPGKAYRDRSDNKWHAIGESVFSPGWMLLESENGARHACRISDGTWGGGWNPQDIIGLWGEPVPCTRPIIKHRVRLRNGDD